ncbi:zinc finger protein [Trichonephila inaurata madagascariensis]|uniref:Zinc finger protein n=1 Tax=Trichonephila inaurata madagascariensis TaxID=2747483 RepID=A0A8X7CJ58_9ARAC|nr:zinc finger protein [Trichonephila inaurata madagascariensis]
MEWQKCDICNKSFTGICNFKEHEASKKHKNKVRYLKQNIPENSKAYLKGYIKCFDCDIICNGLIPYEHHLQGKLHKKTIQRKHYNERNNSPVPSPNSALQNPMEWNSETLEKYYCDICKKQCVSRTPYEIHVLSRGHRKKAGNAEINTKVANIEESGSSSCSKSIETNSVLNTGAISTTDEVDNINNAKSSKYYYNVIRPPFSNHEVKCRKYNNNGLQLYFTERTHHKKKIDSSKDQTYETHFKCYKRCVDCDKIFTGPLPYAQHLQGKAHKKKIAKKLLKNIEIDSLLPATDSTLQNSMQYNSGDVKKYYCEICKKQCTCAIQYDTHILSIAHKKMSKILKALEKE